MIKPTLGRVTWYHPFNSTEIHTALICFVHSDTRVNLAVFDTNGKPYNACSVFVKQENAPAPVNEGYAEWMPYQQKVAKVFDAAFTTSAPLNEAGPTTEVSAEAAANILSLFPKKGGE